MPLSALHLALARLPTNMTDGAILATRLLATKSHKFENKVKYHFGAKLPWKKGASLFRLPAHSLTDKLVGAFFVESEFDTSDEVK